MAKFTNVAFPDSGFKAPAAKEWKDADKVRIIRPGWANAEWSNHFLSYNIFFDENDVAHTPVKSVKGKGKSAESVTTLEEGVLAEHFDAALGDENARILGMVVSR